MPWIVCVMPYMEGDNAYRLWDITQGYWDAAVDGTMPVRDFYRLLHRWAGFRSRMLAFMQH